MSDILSNKTTIEQLKSFVFVPRPTLILSPPPPPTLELGKMQVAIFALFTLLLIIGQATSDECQQGQILHDICNICYCANGQWSCATRCNYDNRILSKIGVPILPCKPGESILFDCNVCTCANEGFWACTRKFCQNKIKASDELSTLTRSNNNQMVCEPGQRQRLDCNHCICTAIGIWMCTQMACPSQERVNRGIDDNLKCSPGEQKQIECNSCYCNQFSHWICTLRQCNPVTPPITRFRRGVPVAADLKNTPCAPNDYFTIDCNTCYCNIDKTGYLCTENLCPIGDNSVTKVENTTIANQETTTIKTNEQQNTNSTNS